LTRDLPFDLIADQIMAGVTIKLFLPKGDAQSLRTAELVNWTGKALAGPRSQLDDLLAREEFAKSGVYIFLALTLIRVNRLPTSVKRKLSATGSSNIVKKNSGFTPSLS